jgi:two-component system sensor histidine kinase KdpD
MDTEAILLRSPAVCLVDEFAHANVPGSARQAWEDVLAARRASTSGPR